MRLVTHEWPADESMRIPFPVTVVMHDSHDDLNEWAAQELDEAHTASAGITTLSDDGQVEIHFSRDKLFLSVIVHEVTHWALWTYSRENLASHPHATAQAHLTNHGEDIPYMVGNVAALIVYGLQNEGYNLEPVED